MDRKKLFYVSMCLLIAVIVAVVTAGTLNHYYLLPSVRGDLLFKLGRNGEARVEFKRAASLTLNEQEKELLLKRAIACVEEE